jgi:5-methyltetrahydrofolate--homocysteine methyltransferase
MELAYKEDWLEARERIEAWWQGEIVDRAVIQVTAPKADVPIWASLRPDGVPEERLRDWFTDPEQVIPRLEARVQTTFWGGEAIPVVYPVSISLVAILAAYLGCPYRIVPGSYSGWASPIIADWNTRPRFAYDPHNPWWLASRELLQAAAHRAPGRYYVGVPDLNGPSEILALLRDSERLAVDLLENRQAVIAALDEINLAWLRYWEACVGTIHQRVGGYLYWMGIWSDLPSIDLQCDFSCMISPRMFEQFFLPGLEQQTRWVARTVYHLDGPNAIRHLDALCSLPGLDGIQWVPGAGKAPASAWIRLLRRIQAKGKLIVLTCEPEEIETLLTELEPEGLLLSTHCSSEEEARTLLRNTARWTARRQWVVEG